MRDTLYSNGEITIGVNKSEDNDIFILWVAYNYDEGVEFNINKETYENLLEYGLKYPVELGG